MYICICNAIRETDLRQAARRHCGDATTLYACMGKSPQCCQCLCDADDVIEEERTCQPA